MTNIRYEVTEKVETGLDVLVLCDEGWICWAYNEKTAQIIVDALKQGGEEYDRIRNSKRV